MGKETSTYQLPPRLASSRQIILDDLARISRTVAKLDAPEAKTDDAVLKEAWEYCQKTFDRLALRCATDRVWIDTGDKASEVNPLVVINRINVCNELKNVARDLELRETRPSQWEETSERLADTVKSTKAMERALRCPGADQTVSFESPLRDQTGAPLV